MSGGCSWLNVMPCMNRCCHGGGGCVVLCAYGMCVSDNTWVYLDACVSLEMYTTLNMYIKNHHFPICNVHSNPHRCGQWTWNTHFTRPKCNCLQYRGAHKRPWVVLHLGHCQGAGAQHYWALTVVCVWREDAGHLQCCGININVYTHKSINSFGV